MVDDSHAVGVLGPGGRGSPEACGVLGRIDILTGTLGKALGGASGGYTSGRKEIIDYLRQRSRPYLFSNALMPAIAATSIAMIDRIETADGLRAALRTNARRFRDGLERLGFTVLPGEHPIVPVMLFDAHKAGALAQRLFELGIYVVAFSYPVVASGQARVRVQISAAHTREQVDQAIEAFGLAGRELGVI